MARMTTVATMLALLMAQSVFGQARPHILQGSAGPQETQTAVLDRVVAVVDETAILASDVDEEIRFAALQPEKEPATDNTPQRALSRLIDRALIDRQRVLQPGLADVSQADVDRAVENLRKTVPGCRQYHCMEEAGWFAFLKAHEFTVQEVDERVRERLEVVKFIDMRFGNAARIPRTDVQKYYDNVLRPALLRNRAVVPEMQAVAPRIREILRQQQIGAMVDEWLKGLHSEGQVQILDSAYASGDDFGGAGRAQ